MRKTKFSLIGNVIKKLIKKQKLDNRLNELTALELFKYEIGKNLLNYVKDINVKNGVIYVKLNSSVVRNELLFQQTNIIKRINSSIGKELIKEIKFR